MSCMRRGWDRRSFGTKFSGSVGLPASPVFNRPRPSTGTWVGLLCAIRLRRMRPKGRGFKPACMRRRTRFFPGNGKTSCQARQIVAILEKFHARGWTAPIPPTYCPDTKISITGRRIEGLGRLTGARRQHRPFYPAFCLLCSALTCILLLAFTLSAPVAGSVAPRVLVHGAQKNAGSLSASAGLEGAKGQVAGKLMSPDGRGVELICPLEAVFTGPFGSAAGVGPGRSRCFADSHLVTSGARAPPADIA